MVMDSQSVDDVEEGKHFLKVRDLKFLNPNVDLWK